jgi:hypothetical protein
MHVAFPLQWLSERATMLHYTHIASLVICSRVFYYLPNKYVAISVYLYNIHKKETLRSNRTPFPISRYTMYV